MNNMINYLTKNKRRISKFLYLAAALIEQLPDTEIFRTVSDLPKITRGRTLNLIDQLNGDGSPPSRKRRGKKRTANK